MNPWQSFRREIGGAVRSLRYDLSRSRATPGAQGRPADDDTVPLPVVTDSNRRHRIALATGAVLLASAGVSGYLVVSHGLDALTGGGAAPSSLPQGQAKPKRPQAQPSPLTSPDSPADVSQIDVLLPTPEATQTTRPAGSTPTPAPTRPGATGTPTPPVPTPAPTSTCDCPTPTPTPSATPTPTASPNSSPSASPTRPPVSPAAVPSAAPQASGEGL